MTETVCGGKKCIYSLKHSTGKQVNSPCAPDIYRLVMVLLWDPASDRRRETMRRRRITASPCLTSGRRPTRWSLLSAWSPECATTSTVTSTPTSNPCYRGTSSLRCQVKIQIWMQCWAATTLVWAPSFQTTTENETNLKNKTKKQFRSCFLLHSEDYCSLD